MEINSGESIFVPPMSSRGPGDKRQRSHYEILEVSPNANRAEIRRAYIHLKGVVDSTHGASYSLLDPQDSESLLAEIEEAYRTLDDDFLRRKYDETLFGAAESQNFASGAPSATAPSPSEQQATRKRPRYASKRLAKRSDDENVKLAVAELIQNTEDVNGALLRSIRELVGAGQDEIQDYLKISNYYIEAIETDNFSNLPPLVYIRGFLKSLLDYLGVDKHNDIIEGYSRSYTEWKKKQGKKKF